MKNFKSINDLGLIRVAAATPKIKVADTDYNANEIIHLAKQADANGVQILVFPELCITGYTAGDLFQNRSLLNAAEESLNRIVKQSYNLNILLVVGLPLEVEGKIYNVAAVIGKGKIFGFVPKTFLPNYKEFYEKRWFVSSRNLAVKEITISGKKIPIGIDLLFSFKNFHNAVLGIEICEDLWTPLPPSSFQAISGATIIANLSASNELSGKADYRRILVSQQSARNICGYIYSSSGVYESTTDVVFGGHSIIAENGNIKIESKRFSRKSDLLISEIDIEHLLSDREKTTSFVEGVKGGSFRIIEVALNKINSNKLYNKIDSLPFVPQYFDELNKRSEEIFSIQSAGLAKRLEFTCLKNLIIGLSGGLDSTLALLVAVKTFHLLKLPLKNIKCFTMPGLATTKRTKNNAIKLAEALGVNIETIDISEGVLSHFKDLKHDKCNQDLVFENTQARYRTMILMNKANQLKGLVVGTGDLSEIALGWCTFSGDHISHYNVNACIPKTLVRHLINWVSEQKEFTSGQKELKDILNTPISPELVGNGNDEVIQKTEDLIGPYELHDFFLYHFVRWGSAPKKILFLALLAFKGKYNHEIIKKWLTVFIKRFFTNQWKRSVMPDGPKVGSVSLSPRGDWRMPSDGEMNIWLKELNKI